MSFPGCFGPGINNVNIMFSFFMHNIGGKLYVTSITGQQLYLELKMEKGLKPSVASPSLRLRGSAANEGHLSLTMSQAKESTG
ncbi:hypothetical protein RchiOBHm_Chr5g0064771 [Rosa chinensis]|uniref:Uncharacterized protein n=1 Tax=Rosa chinensis TaxID=74649 RepID=A0A2P6QIS1_ROSCH|nr:hypothetical protein RchiOBHm_Chr5g0064771 [Rosa chinensis]